MVGFKKGDSLAKNTTWTKQIVEEETSTIG